MVADYVIGRASVSGPRPRDRHLPDLGV